MTSLKSAPPVGDSIPKSSNPLFTVGDPFLILMSEGELKVQPVPTCTAHLGPMTLTLDTLHKDVTTLKAEVQELKERDKVCRQLVHVGIPCLVSGVLVLCSLWLARKSRH